MALLTYNGISLPYTDTTTFNQSMIMEDSNTDWILTRFDISVQCILNAAYLPILTTLLVNNDGSAKTQNATDIMNVLRSKLLSPRKTLSFKVNGVELIPQKVASNKGPVDAKNGPLPQNCTIVQLTDATFFLSYSIVAHYWETEFTGINTTVPTDPTSQGAAGTNVLSNRWTETVEIDAGGYSTRRRQGRIILRSDNPDGVIADNVRTQMAAVKIPWAFRRTASSYTIDPSGLALSYSFTDQEQFLQPPSPAYEAEGSYTETVTSVGARRYGHVELRLRGSRNTNRSTLISVASAICTAKLWRSSDIIDDNSRQLGIITNASVRVSLYSCEVSMSMTNLFTTTDANGQTQRMAGITAFTDAAPVDNNPLNEGLATAWTPLTQSIDGGVLTNNGSVPDYFIRGTFGLLLHAAAYYDPSIVTAINQATGQLNQGREPGTAGKNGE